MKSIFPAGHCARSLLSMSQGAFVRLRLLFALAGVLLAAGSMQAQLINETFTSSPASNFTVVSGGTWSVSGGQYLLTNPAAGSTSGNGNISTQNTNVTGNWTLTVDGSVKSTTSVWDDFSVIFGYQSSTNYYFLNFNESNDGAASGLFKIAGGVSTQLADVTSLITAGTTYAVQIVKSGSTYTAKRNGVTVATATDATWASGKVGLGSRNNAVNFDNLIVTLPVAAPAFSPGGGTYTGAQSVTITTATSGATIRYTTNGTTPSPTVGTVYSTPVSISATTTLKAIAYKSGMTNSTVTSATYTITAPTTGPTNPNQTGLSGVGINRTTLPVASKYTYTSADAGTVITNQHFTNTVWLNPGANNITFKKCWFSNPGSNFSVFGNTTTPPSNTTFEDCDFGQRGSANWVAVTQISGLGGTNHIRRCFFYNSADGIKWMDGSVNYIEDSWVQPIYVSPTHMDGMQINDGYKAKFYATRCTFEVRTWTFGGVVAFNQEELTAGTITVSNIFDWGNSVTQTKPCGTSGVGCETPRSDCYYSYVNCIMTGANYIITAANQGGVFQNNTVIRGSGAPATDLGLRDAQNFTISGNKFHDNGATYSGGGVGKGTNPTPISRLGL